MLPVSTRNKRIIVKDDDGSKTTLSSSASQSNDDGVSASSSASKSLLSSKPKSNSNSTDSKNGGVKPAPAAAVMKTRGSVVAVTRVTRSTSSSLPSQRAIFAAASKSRQEAAKRSTSPPSASFQMVSEHQIKSATATSSAPSNVMVKEEEEQRPPPRQVQVQVEATQEQDPSEMLQAVLDASSNKSTVANTLQTRRSSLRSSLGRAVAPKPQAYQVPNQNEQSPPLLVGRGSTPPGSSVLRQMDSFELNLDSVADNEFHANLGVGPFEHAHMDEEDLQFLNRASRNLGADHGSSLHPSSRHHRPSPSGLPLALSQATIINTAQGPAILLNDLSSLGNSGVLPSLLSRSDAPSTTTAAAAATTTHLAAMPVQPVVTQSTTQAKRFQRWSEEEDLILQNGVAAEGDAPHNWKRIAKKYFNNLRTANQCKSRWTKNLQPGLKRGNWTAEEDQTILKLRQEGMAWGAIAEHLPGRIGEQVRDRFVNSLDPELKKTPWTEDETRALYHYQSIHGNKWTEIAKHLPGRSENAVKNRWHNAKMAKIRRQRRLAKEMKAKAERERSRAHTALVHNPTSTFVGDDMVVEDDDGDDTTDDDMDVIPSTGV